MTRLAFVALLAACIAALAVARPGSAADTPAVMPAGQDVESRSAALAAAPALERFTVDTGVPAELARTVAAEVARAVPLPTGGTFDGIRWEQAGGTFSRREIAALLQYNAACQWLRASRDGREPGVSDRILAQIASWPAWREGEAATRLAAVVGGIRSGTGGPEVTGALAECDASQAREVQYAKSLGLTPTR